MILADAMVTPQQGARDPYWDEEAKALLVGLLLYVALDERESEDRTLGRVREIIRMGEDSFKDLLLQMMENENPVVTSTAERTLSKESKLRGGILSTLQSHTNFLDSLRIRDSLRRSDFRFEDLKMSKMTVYLVLPADRLNTFGRWLRLLVQQAITVNARNIEAKPEKPILFFLDEMAALGRLSMVEQAYGLMAGFGMQLWGIVQDLSQLESIYGKGWETFIGNSGVLQYFGSRDHKTAEYFSKLCGVTTVVKFSIARSIANAFGRSWSSSSGGQGGSSTSGGNESTTYSDSSTMDVVQRHLAYPDELMVLRENKQIVLIENFNPIKGVREPWYQNEKMKSLGIDLHAGKPAEKEIHVRIEPEMEAPPLRQREDFGNR
jgi:type IV secretion system protein VirD4